MYTPQRDKITFKTRDESDQVFDMSCVCVTYLCVVLGFSLDSVCAHGSKYCPSNEGEANECTIMSEFTATSFVPKFWEINTQTTHHSEQ